MNPSKRVKVTFGTSDKSFTLSFFSILFYLLIAADV